MLQFTVKYFVTTQISNKIETELLIFFSKNHCSFKITPYLCTLVFGAKIRQEI